MMITIDHVSLDFKYTACVYVRVNTYTLSQCTYTQLRKTTRPHACVISNKKVVFWLIVFSRDTGVCH